MLDPPDDRAYLLDMPAKTKTAKPFADLDAALDLAYLLEWLTERYQHCHASSQANHGA